MRVYSGKHLGDFYSRLLADVMGSPVLNPRGKPNREFDSPVTLVTNKWGALTGAGVNYRFATAEALAYLCGWSDVKWLAKFRPEIARFSDNGETFYGAYGERLFLQLRPALEKLAKDPDSRQATCAIWFNGDVSVESKDLPCNTELHLKIRHNSLRMLVVRRSSDLIWGLPYDHHAFWFLLTTLASCLRVAPGPLVEVADSLHVYNPEAGFYDAERVAKALSAEHTAVSEPVLSFFERGKSLDEFRVFGAQVRKEVEHDVMTGTKLGRWLIGQWSRKTGEV